LRLANPFWNIKRLRLLSKRHCGGNDHGRDLLEEEEEQTGKKAGYRRSSFIGVAERLLSHAKLLTGEKNKLSFLFVRS